MGLAGHRHAGPEHLGRNPDLRDDDLQLHCRQLQPAGENDQTGRHGLHVGSRYAYSPPSECLAVQHWRLRLCHGILPSLLRHCLPSRAPQTLELQGEEENLKSKVLG